MFFIVEVQGCLPYVAFVVDEETGEAIHFETLQDAEYFAMENCAWEYRILEF